MTHDTQVLDSPAAVEHGKWPMSIHQLLVKGVIPVGLKISNAGFGYLTTLVAAWVLTPADYGLFGTVIAFSLLCSFALSYGQPVAMIKFYNERMVQAGEWEADGQLSWSLFAGCLCLLICGAIGTGWLFYGKTDLAGMGAILLFCLLFSFGELIAVALRVKERMIAALAPRDFGWRLLVILLLLGWYRLAQPATTQSLLWLMSLSLLPFLLYQLMLLRRHLRWQPVPAYAAQYHKRSCHFWGIVLTGPILTQAGTLIVSSSFDLEVSGAYFAAERTSNLLTFLLVAIHVVVGPRLSRAFEERDFAKTQRLVALSALAASSISLMLFVPLVLFRGQVLAWFSPQYSVHGELLLWLALVQLFNAMAGVTAFFLQMAGKERQTLLLSGLFTLLSLVLQLWVAQVGSLAQIAMVSAGISLLLNGACIYACWRYTGIDTTALGLLRKQGVFQ